MAKKEYERSKDGANIAKIIVDRELCIGAATCIAVAAETFELDDENKAIVVDANQIDDETLLTSAQSCPTAAIILIDKDGKQVYP